MSLNIEYPQQFDDSWEQLKSMLLSPKPNSEYDIMSIFGPNAYLCKNFKQQVRTLKRLFDDLCFGYWNFVDLINGQAQLQ